MLHLKPPYQFSYFHRNGEDIVFEDAAFHQMAYEIALGPHQFGYAYSSLGLELTFTTERDILEVRYEYEHRWERGVARIWERKRR